MARRPIEIPPGLSVRASAWFSTVARQFKLRTGGELAILGQAALSLTRIEQCQQTLAAEGLFVDGSRGRVAHPGVRAELQHRALFLQACRALGISNPQGEPQ
jgi:hypothetical protein